MMMTTGASSSPTIRPTMCEAVCNFVAAGQAGVPSCSLSCRGGFSGPRIDRIQIQLANVFARLTMWRADASASEEPALPR